MRTRTFLIGSICFLVLGLPAMARADSLGLTYIVTGTGGLSQATPGLSNAPFWSIDTSAPGGQVTGSVLVPYGFDAFTSALPIGSGVFPAFETNGVLGSFLLSSSFMLNADESASVSFSALTNSAQPYFDLAFGALLRNGSVAAILGVVRPDGFNVWSDMPGPSSSRYPLPSPGVSSTIATSGPRNLVLDGVQYGQPSKPGDCFDRCITEVTSTLTPGAGSYQLLFGVFGAPHALAVTSVSVPEPGTLGLIGVGLLALGFSRRRLSRASIAGTTM